MFDSIVESDRLFSGGSINEFVPPVTKENAIFQMKFGESDATRLENFDPVLPEMRDGKGLSGTKYYSVVTHKNGSYVDDVIVELWSYQTSGFCKVLLKLIAYLAKLGEYPCF